MRSHLNPTEIPGSSCGISHRDPRAGWDRSHRASGIPVGSRNVSPLNAGIEPKWAFARGSEAFPTLSAPQQAAAKMPSKFRKVCLIRQTRFAADGELRSRSCRRLPA